MKPKTLTDGKMKLNHLWERGRRFLGSSYAILGGAMSWVSERHLVSALSNAGGFGIIACGAMTPDLLREEIQATQKMTSNPFGVNLITMHPEIEALIQICIDLHVSHVVLAGGLPSASSIEKLKKAHIKVICFTPALSLGKRLIRMGVDALVIEGMEAGGHIGPVSTSVLAQEILPHMKDVPVFVAGGIGRGETIVSYLELGASGCQLGTRFVCAHESIAHENFKKAFIRGHARDAQTSTQLDSKFPVIPVRALANEGTKVFMEKQREILKIFYEGTLSQEEAQLEIERFWAGALRRAVIDGDVKTGSLMAGQSVGLVKTEQSMQDIMDELVSQALGAIEEKYFTQAA